MPRKLKEVEEEALELKLDDRAALAAGAENERLWLAEAERRQREIQSGQVKALPGEEALRRAVVEIS